MDDQILDAGTGNTALNINQEGIDALRDTRKWARFISYVGFAFLGLFVLVGIFAGSIFSSFSGQLGIATPGIFFSGIYFLIALLGFFPNLYLYKYANFIGLALRSMDPGLLTSALLYEKRMYRYIGIYLAVVLGFYGMIILFGMIAAMFT